MLRRRIAALATVIAAVVVFAAAIYVISHHEPVAQAGQTPGFTASPPGIPTVRVTSSAAANSSAPASSGNPSAKALHRSEPLVVFLGDDYTLGVGATSKAKRFSTLIGISLHVRAKTVASSGAGYAKSGTDGKSYGDLVTEVVAGTPSMVVVSGGRNDTSDDPATLAAQATTLFATLHAKLPKAKLVAVAPFWGNSPPPAALSSVATSVQSAVQAVGGTYLAIPDPLLGHAGFMSDSADPNDDGYAAIANAVGPALAPLLPKT
ncbi:MAG: SGNH/GDSL hydrolase family protein [Jatrophihabitantaceae bacterium]